METIIEGVEFIGESKLCIAYPPVYSPQPDLRLRGGDISVPVGFFNEISNLGRDTLGNSGGLLSQPGYCYFIRNPDNGKYFFGRAGDFNESKELLGTEFVYIPDWMFRSFGATEGSVFEFRYAKITEVEKPYIKLMPLTENFYKCKDPCKVLEEVLNSFAAASLNFHFTADNPENPGDYIDFTVVETKPFPTVTLLHGETTIDFAPMPGYEEKMAAEEEKKKKAAEGGNDVIEIDDDDDDDDVKGSGKKVANDSDDDDGAVKLDKSKGHSLSDSMQNTEDRTLCPSCGKYIANQSYRLHSMRCARLYTKCAECGASVLKTGVEAHKKEFHAPVPCPKCGAEVPSKALLEKHAETCPKACVPCKYCKKALPRADLPEHEDYCGSKTTLCEKCGTRVMLRSYEAHVAGGCKKVAPVAAAAAENAPAAAEVVPSAPPPPPQVGGAGGGGGEQNLDGPKCPFCKRVFGGYGNEFSAHVNACEWERKTNGGKKKVAEDKKGGIGAGAAGEVGGDEVCPMCGKKFGNAKLLENHFFGSH